MTKQKIQRAFELALGHHQAGRLHEAELGYRQILASEPRHADALHNLGVAAAQGGRKDRAVELFVRAIALKPNFPSAHRNLGNALKDNLQLDEAIVAYQRAITLNPNFPDVHYDLGLVLKTTGQLDEAVAAYRRAITLKPGYPEAWCDLGNALKEKGQLDEAIAAYRQAVALRPNYAEAHSNLGNALTDKGQLDEAIAACRQAIALKPSLFGPFQNLGVALQLKEQPDEAIAAYRQVIALEPNFSEVHCNLGNALKDTGKLNEAIAAYRQAIFLNPNFADAHSNLANALRDVGQFHEAIAACHQAIALKPNFPEAHCNLANTLKDIGQLDEAIAAYRRATALQPGAPFPHFSLALALLARGDFEEGCEEHEWRWKWKDFPSPVRNFAQPQWEGEPLESRTLLIHAEQGFGDTLQFIRYAPLAARRGGKILIECPTGLQRLLGNLPDGCRLVDHGVPLPDFDFHCPLLSLPRVFTTTQANLPHEVPYLWADARDAARWQHRLSGSREMKVGLAWAGNPTHNNDHNRSMKLPMLATLGRVPGVRFFSLQKGAAVTEAKIPPAGMDLVDWTEELKDFADTAALIANLDLVIAVDTAVAHLAGAMGKPVWTLLPVVPDWRWLMAREDSPWYPSMRLFRQTCRGDWDGVVNRVTKALSEQRHERT